MTINNEERDFIQEVLAEDAAQRAGKAPFVSNTREFMAAKKAKPDLAARCEALQQLLNDRDQKLDELAEADLQHRNLAIEAGDLVGKLRADIDNLEAEKFALEDQVKGLQELGAPVPPAGDVEAVCEVVDEKYNRVQFYRQTGDTSKPYHRPGEKLYDQACVTRLTAERDKALAEVERLNLMLDEENDRVHIAVDMQQKALRGRDALKSELTKARNLISTLEARLMCKDKGIDFRDALISEASELAYKELPATWLSRASTICAHHSAPAAKGGDV